jgi:zinc protease
LQSEAPARVRREPFAELLAELNKDRVPTAIVRHDATIAFGPEMQVQRFVLGNGLKVLILEDHAAPVACLQVWFGVGSRHEKVGKTGISHLFEHLMFGETDRREHGAFDKLLEEAGAETNAATFLDWTYYHANLPKEAMALAVRLEAERMTGLVLRDPQVTSEKEVVSNERRQYVDDDVDGAVSELLYKEAFKEHAYRWPTIGWMEDIQGFTTEDCTAFYKTYYAPNNAAMVVVGDVSTREVLSLVQEHYGKLEPSVIPIEDVKPEPPQTEERRQRVAKPTPTQKVAIGYKCPALGDYDYAPLVLLNELLFGGRSSRVHRALVQEQEVATEVRGSVGAFHDPSLYDIYLVARGEHTTDDLIAALDKVLDEVRLEAPGEAELDKAKARVELSMLQGLETVAGKAGQIGFFETVLGSPDALFEKLSEYRRVKRDDLLRVARRYLVASGRTVIEVIPQEGGADEEEDGDESSDTESQEEAS